jgi:uncharacterized protein YggE
MRLVLILLFTLLSHSLWADEHSSYIAVNADGWTEAVPDTLMLTVTASAAGTDLTKISSQVDKVSQQVVEAAREFGVAEDDIDSSRMNMRPEYEWHNQSRRYLGDVVSRDISLTIRDLDRYGELMQTLTLLDLQAISPPRFGFSTIESLQLAALKDALQKARRKAASIAGTIGAELGSVLRVQEQGFVGRPEPRMLAAEAMSVSAAAAPEFQFGKQRITASVEVRYGIE